MAPRLSHSPVPRLPARPCSPPAAPWPQGVACRWSSSEGGQGRSVEPGALASFQGPDYTLNQPGMPGARPRSSEARVGPAVVPDRLPAPGTPSGGQIRTAVLTRSRRPFSSPALWPPRTPSPLPLVSLGAPSGLVNGLETMKSRGCRGLAGVGPGTQVHGAPEGGAGRVALRSGACLSPPRGGAAEASPREQAQGAGLGDRDVRAPGEAVLEGEGSRP